MLTIAADNTLLFREISLHIHSYKLLKLKLYGYAFVPAVSFEL